MKKTFAIGAILVAVLLAAVLVGCLFGHRDRLRYHGGGLSFSADGRKIALGSSREGKGDIYLLSADGTTLERITTGPSSSGWPAMSPDGNRIYFALGSNDPTTCQLYAMRSDGSGRQRLTSNDWCDTSPSVSADGKKLIFARATLHRPYSMGGYVWDNWDVWLMNADGTGQMRLTRNTYYGIAAPHLSPDGTHAIFSVTTHQSIQNRIYLFDLDANNVASAPRELRIGQPPEREYRDLDPSLSPDGKRIVFISDREIPFDYEVWIADADGANPKQLTHIHSMSSSPVFSPDGQFVFFLSDHRRSGAQELWRVQADGMGLQRVRDGL